MKMVTDRNYSSDVSSEQKVIKRTGIIAKLLGLDEQNLKVYNVLSEEIRALAKKLDNYHFEYNSLKKTVKRLEKDVKFLETEYLNECIDRKTVVDLIKELALSPNNKKMLKKGEVNIATVDFYESSSSVRCSKHKKDYS